jgi:hypothetical protein
MNSHRIAAGLAGLTAALTCAGASFASTGPSSSDAPYLVPSRPGVELTSILTAGDKVDGYQMVGIPDGLGAYDNGDGTFTLLMNHELRRTQGTTRAHGAKGAFVSRWIVDKDTLAVQSGRDQITTLHVAAGTPTALERLCSADLPALSAFYNPASGKGYDGRIFMNGEETSGGRAFAHVVDTGDSYQLEALGTAEWENLLANPATGDKTVVAGTSDSTPGEISVYTGEKQTTGNAIEKAGLTGGTRKVVKVDGVGIEDDAAGIPSGTRFSLAEPGAGTGFLRPEDGAWDPKNPSDFYFVTTGRGYNSSSQTWAPSRLWRLRFDDPANPAAGGTVDELLDGSEGQHMLDNLTITRRGDILIQEDPGNNAYVAKIWRYKRQSDQLTEIAHHDPSRFEPGAAGFITQDEESSGIVDVSDILGNNKFLLDDQVHTAPAADAANVVERGQLLAMSVRDRGVNDGPEGQE